MSWNHFFSTIVKLSPFGRWMRKPEPIPESSGMDVSSAYVNDALATSASKNVIHARNGTVREYSVPTTKPCSFVKHGKKPRNVAEVVRSADTKYAMTGIPSVTNLCSTRDASLAEIMVSLMEVDFGKEAAERRCKQLGFF